MADLRITQTTYRLIRHIANGWVERERGIDDDYWDFNYGQVVTGRIRELIAAGLAYGTDTPGGSVMLTAAGRQVLEAGNPAGGPS